MLLPRLAQTISRPRIALWLARHTKTPLRLLIAPMGSGKTTAVVSYLRQRGVPFAYCAVSPQFTIDSFSADLASSLGFDQPADYASLKRSLDQAGHVQIAVENIDMASPPLRDWLARLVEEAGDNVAFIYTSRSWNAVDVQRLAAQGVAAVLDDRMLAFQREEVGSLCEMLGVPFTVDEAAELCDDTEGWPILTAGVIREAFEHGRTLAHAYDLWRNAQTHLFRQYLESCVEQVDGAALEAWDHFIANGKLFSESGAEQLRRAGLPVRRDLHGTYFPYRTVEQLFNSRVAVASIQSKKSQPLVVRVLGDFEAVIGAEPVKWIRRRDQQIFLYLLLKDSGNATRAELCEQFWPDVEPELRSASLRVACSNIRRAIANLAGSAGVENYFRSDGDIAVNFEHITLDARRFRSHVSDGDEHEARGNHQEALAHYRMAESLYAGRIGWCSNAEDWVQAHADLSESLDPGVLRRLVAMHRRAEDAPQLDQYSAAASTKLHTSSRRELQAKPAC
ncbi:MAG: hypothetical protein NVSMB31_05150 [Vulcanimicrobiaceae bacterium]